jgi:hypothetical protein
MFKIKRNVHCMNDGSFYRIFKCHCLTGDPGQFLARVNADFGISSSRQKRSVPGLVRAKVMRCHLVF